MPFTASTTQARGAASGAPPASRGSTPAPGGSGCLSHHQILRWAAPCVRRGLQLDLAASDRAARTLQFVPRLHPPTGERPALQERWQLHSPRDGQLQLTRSLQVHAGPHAGLQARLMTEGSDTAALLEALLQADPVQDFAWGEGWALACSHRLQDGQRLPLEAQLRAAGMALHLRVPDGFAGSLPRVSASVVLHAAPGTSVPTGPSGACGTPGPATPAEPLPDDLLAVLGWHWSPLEPHPVQAGWRASLRLHGAAGRRSRDLMLKLQAAAQHLAGTLTQPPQHFHQRLAAARWRVALRRSLPMLAGLVFGLEAAFAPTLRGASDSLVTAGVLAVPPALLLLFLWRSERPRIEWPRLPRPLAGLRWQTLP